MSPKPDPTFQSDPTVSDELFRLDLDTSEIQVSPVVGMQFFSVRQGEVFTYTVLR